MIHYAVSSSPRLFLAAAFETESALDVWLETVPAELRPTLTKRVAAGHRFPTFLLEDDDLRWAAESELPELLRTWAETERPPDWVYGNLYFVEHPWHPPRPGTDFMGSIPHVHVQREHLEELRRAGLDALHECWLSAETVARIRRARA
jgi:hypothetical protein